MDALKINLRAAELQNLYGKGDLEALKAALAYWLAFTETAKAAGETTGTTAETTAATVETDAEIAARMQKQAEDEARKQAAAERAAEQAAKAAAHEAHAAADKAATIAKLLAELTATPKAEPLDPEAVRAIVAEEVAKQAPRFIEIKTATATAKVDGQQHPLFEKVCRLAAAGVNVLITGPAGSGKTHAAEQVAKALSLNYGAIHCTAGASESQLFGWLLPTGEGGRFEYNPAPFINLYENGRSLFLFDELDAADPNFLLAANSALANGHVHVPMRTKQPEVARGENVVIMATANTYGTGADMIYAGRNQLDGATLDRFYIVHWDYMAGLEASMMGQHKTAAKAWQPASMEQADITADLATLYGWLVNVRKGVETNKLRRVISTRAFQKAAAARTAGVPVAEIKADLLAGWTVDEVRKVGA